MIRDDRDRTRPLTYFRRLPMPEADIADALLAVIECKVNRYNEQPPCERAATPRGLSSLTRVSPLGPRMLDDEVYRLSPAYYQVPILQWADLYHGLCADDENDARTDCGSMGTDDDPIIVLLGGPPRNTA